MFKTTLNAVAAAFSAKNNFVVETSSEWVKVTDKYLYDDLCAYFVEDEDEVTYYIHIPGAWNSVLESYNLDDVVEFKDSLEEVLNEIPNITDLEFSAMELYPEDFEVELEGLDEEASDYADAVADLENTLTSELSLIAGELWQVACGHYRFKTEEDARTFIKNHEEYADEYIEVMNEYFAEIDTDVLGDYNKALDAAYRKYHLNEDVA